MLDEVNILGKQRHETLPTYIRNTIDHPDSGRKYEQAELRKSIVYLRNLITEYLHDGKYKLGR